MHTGTALALLFTLAAACLLVWFVQHARAQARRQRRRERRQANLGYQNAWNWVFRRQRHQRLTDQRARDER